MPRPNPNAELADIPPAVQAQVNRICDTPVDGGREGLVARVLARAPKKKTNDLKTEDS